MNTTKANPLLGTLLALTVSASLAQSADAAMSPLKGADRQYLTQSAQGSVADEATAELGIQKAQANTVQHYAIRVVEDHARLNMQMLLMAHSRDLTLPLMMESKDKTTLQSLMGENGAAFDRAFLRQEVKVNAMDVQDARKELTTTTDPQVREFVQEFLNTEQIHLARARELLAGMQK